MKENPYDERYTRQEYYWGKKHFPICDRVIEIAKSNLKPYPKLLDLGCEKCSIFC